MITLEELLKMPKPEESSPLEKVEIDGFGTVYLRQLNVAERIRSKCFKSHADSWLYKILVSICDADGNRLLKYDEAYKLDHLHEDAARSLIAAILQLEESIPSVDDLKKK